MECDPNLMFPLHNQEKQFNFYFKKLDYYLFFTVYRKYREMLFHNSMGTLEKRSYIFVSCLELYGKFPSKLNKRPSNNVNKTFTQNVSTKTLLFFRNVLVGRSSNFFLFFLCNYLFQCSGTFKKEKRV